MERKDFTERLKACRNYSRKVTVFGLCVSLTIVLLPLPFSRYLGTLPEITQHSIAILWIGAMSSSGLCWFIKALRIGKKFELCCPACGYDQYRASDSEIEQVLDSGKCAKCGILIFSEQ